MKVDPYENHVRQRFTNHEADLTRIKIGTKQ